MQRKTYGYELAEGDAGRTPTDEQPTLSLSEAREQFQLCREADEYFGRERSAATKQAEKNYDAAINREVLRDMAEDVPDCDAPETEIAEPRQGLSQAAVNLRARFAREKAQ